MFTSELNLDKMLDSCDKMFGPGYLLSAGSARCFLQDLLSGICRICYLRDSAGSARRICCGIWQDLLSAGFARICYLQILQNLLSAGCSRICYLRDSAICRILQDLVSAGSCRICYLQDWLSGICRICYLISAEFVAGFCRICYQDLLRDSAGSAIYRIRRVWAAGF